MRAWQKIICKTPHFSRFSVIFVCFLTLLVSFCHTLFLPICLFFSHLVWQDSLARQYGIAAQQNTWVLLAGRNFGRKGLNFGRMKLLAPLKNYPDTPMVTPGMPSIALLAFFFENPLFLVMLIGFIRCVIQGRMCEAQGAIHLLILIHIESIAHTLTHWK